jgi:hypothetical protein
MLHRVLHDAWAGRMWSARTMTRMIMAPSVSGGTRGGDGPNKAGFTVNATDVAAYSLGGQEGENFVAAGVCGVGGCISH